MPTTNIREEGLESLIVSAMTGNPTRSAGTTLRESAAPYGSGWLAGDPKDYDRAHALDLAQLIAFVRATQPALLEPLGLEKDSPRQQQFLARLQGEIAKRGVVDVLRNGVSHGAHMLQLFYGTPSPGNARVAQLYAANRFSVTRQLRYSLDETQRALDLCLFINGLPVITMELKNRLTRQNVADAVLQYKRDRSPREALFALGRCLVHLAVDENEVWMCTQVRGSDSWFLPLNKGYNDGAGNPPNPHGCKTDYLWLDLLTRASLTDIIENYAQMVEEKEEGTGRKRRKVIFPRYHQLDVVRKLLAACAQQGTGRRFLIEHSAGSGKSNSIAWLAFQLVGMQRGGRALYDSVIVVTDRIILDKQIRDTIKQYAQVAATVGHAVSSGDLRTYLQAGKKIIITTVQKFPFILDGIGTEHRGHTFAIIIDEAHSSQGGRTTAQMHAALTGIEAEEDDETVEDAINRIIAARRMLPNASYFAFTATPKNKTLELFGEAFEEGGEVKHRPFHSYTMKQAIQEGFILDVLANYTPVASYYRLIKTVADDPEYDIKKAQKLLRRYVEGHDYAIGVKAEIIVEHFHDQVIAARKIDGQARGMVVTGGIHLAIQYYHAIRACLLARKSPYEALVAFSGEHNYGGRPVTEALLNGFPSNLIAERFREEPYRLLVVADKFQTGYDEPLLHTMYVDKKLSDIKAVQTLSRLNRAHPQKYDTFVLDFFNTADDIRAAFEPYYRTTILSSETDPNKLHDLQAALENAQVFSSADVEIVAELYLKGASRARLEPPLEACVERYQRDLQEDAQVAFKSDAKTFVRTYQFLGAILTYANAGWEKLSILLSLLIPKLPTPEGNDAIRGMLEAVDMDSYRLEVNEKIKIILADQNGEIEPVPTSSVAGIPQPELDRLSQIIAEFNDMWGGIAWQNNDRIRTVITQEIPQQVLADRAYQNARQQGDAQNTRIEYERALERVIISMFADHTELYKQFSDDPDFKRWLSNKVFELTYGNQAA